MGSRHSRRLSFPLSFCFYSLTAFLVHSFSHSQPPASESLKQAALQFPKNVGGKPTQMPLLSHSLASRVAVQNHMFCVVVGVVSIAGGGEERDSSRAAQQRPHGRRHSRSPPGLSIVRQACQSSSVCCSNPTGSYSLTLSSTICFSFLCIAKFILWGFLLQLSNLEVWFQRPKDIVRKLLSGDLDLGIAGFDTVSEYGQVTIPLVSTSFGFSFRVYNHIRIGDGILTQQWRKKAT